MHRFMITTATLCLTLLMSGCSSYQYAKNVKIIAFHDLKGRGQSVGPVEGQDCMWRVLGYQFSENPSLDRAFMDAKKHGGEHLSYIKNVSTKNTGFVTGIVDKQCLVVQGEGVK